MSSASPTRVRHKILGLTVLVYFITYLDRVLISNAMPVIQKQFGFSITIDVDKVDALVALGQIPSGRIAEVHGEGGRREHEGPGPGGGIPVLHRQTVGIPADQLVLTVTVDVGQLNGFVLIGLGPAIRIIPERKLQGRNR